MSLPLTSGIRFVVVVLALAALDRRPLMAQEAARIELLAPVLAAEDARAWRPTEMNEALVATDSFVRQKAAMAVGRIGDSRGVALLLPLLIDPDTTVRVAAVFALGLLGDTAAIEPLINRMTTPPALDAASAPEAITALARIGGARVGDFFAAVVQNRAPLAIADREALVSAIALESWRLGPDAPTSALLPLLTAPEDDLRWRTAFTLGRLQVKEAASRLAQLLRDDYVLTRGYAARAFTPAYVDAAGLDRDATAALVAQLIDDPDDGVRIDALRTVGALRARRFTDRVVPQLNDRQPNVRVQAAMTLGDLGGTEAVAALREAVGDRGNFAVRRAALLGLARADTAAFRAEAARWVASPDWVERMTAAEAAGALANPAALLSDRDPRVVAAALSSLPDDPASARKLLDHADAAVRSVAAGILSRAADPVDLTGLIRAYHRAARDSFPDAAISALEAMSAIARGSAAADARVTREFLAREPQPSSYVIRQWAEDRWPAAATRWAAPFPIATGRTLQDYREIARRYMVGADSLARPHVTIETEQHGAVELALSGPDAPLTVANFMALVDRHFFDGSRWHRVIPNFVAQDGDPRGDGWGSSGGLVRDEINRVRYLAPVIGMALSGPDTGTSQWFINLSPQPHLDGAYTVFGRVVGGRGSLMRITQGDVIRTIRR